MSKELKLAQEELAQITKELKLSLQRGEELRKDKRTK